jgi:AcrR family transcriptional regulator
MKPNTRPPLGKERPGSVARSSRRLDRDERRRQILAAALSCFADRGFSGTTTRELARRVGITEAALYRYFPSKESLYSAMLDEKMSPVDVVDYMAPLEAAGDDRAFFRELARELFRRLESDPDLLRILLFTGLEGHALSGPLFATRVRRMREFITDYVARRIGVGAFRAVDPVLAARAFLGMVFDHIHVRLIYGQAEAYPHSLDEVAETFADIFLGGVRCTPEAGDR